MALSGAVLSKIDEIIAKREEVTQNAVLVQRLTTNLAALSTEWEDATDASTTLLAELETLVAALDTLYTP